MVVGGAAAPEDVVARRGLVEAVGGAHACRIHEMPHKWVAWEEKK